ncbi:hypothetical protein EVAR_17709_1 [Eumeta japonica]|uniref:Uncharacterized protein n=1 Tax=Eumeta variegata TaxID=151549 RepID=A0A4C1URS9_EUMVA|nr:hypothetical protein EVAR_17709_1 [Eumeta japonica]
MESPAPKNGRELLQFYGLKHFRITFWSASYPRCGVLVPAVPGGWRARKILRAVAMATPPLRAMLETAAGGAAFEELNTFVTII